MTGIRSISTSVATNACSTLSRGRVSGQFITKSTYSIIITSITITINSTIVIGRVSNLFRHKFMYYISHRHSKTFIIINTIVTTMVEGKTFVLLITKFNNSVTAHIEITCLDVIVACTIVGASSLSAPLCLE